MRAALVAHGIGGREDLPLPLGWAVAGAATAVVLSFVLLGVLWREPRLDAEKGGRPLPAGLARALDAPAFRRTLAGLGLLGAVVDPARAGVRPGRRAQPGAVGRLRARLGGPRPGVGAVRAGLAAGEPVAHRPRAAQSRARARPARRRPGAPRTAGLVAGRGGAVRLRLAGAGLLRSRGALDAAVGDRVLRGRQPVRGAALRQPLVRPRRRPGGVVRPLRQDLPARQARRRRRPGAPCAARGAGRRRGPLPVWWPRSP